MQSCLDCIYIVFFGISHLQEGENKIYWSVFLFSETKVSYGFVWGLVLDLSNVYWFFKAIVSLSVWQIPSGFSASLWSQGLQSSSFPVVLFINLNYNNKNSQFHILSATVLIPHWICSRLLVDEPPKVFNSYFISWSPEK